MNRRVDGRGGHAGSICVMVALVLTSSVAVAQNDASLRAGANALLAIDQHRPTVIERIVSQWAAADARLDAVQLRATLASLRADDLLAASLAGTPQGVGDVLANAQGATPKASDGLVQTKALGDSAIDVVYTPVTPCRLVETRGTFAAVYQGGGAFSGGTSRNYTVQGGNGVCLAQLPADLNPSAVQLQMFGMPINTGASGDIEILPQGSTFGTTTTQVYVGSVAFNTVSTTAKINLANNQIAIQVRGGGANVAIDVVGYFKRPANYAGIHGVAGLAATDSGGYGNTASGDYSAIGGGAGNIASGEKSVVAGGSGNTASGIISTVEGGHNNTASGAWSMVPGGTGNVAGGSNSFAGGNYAQAASAGEFVWADNTLQYFNPQTANHGWSNPANTFNVRATGGVWFVSGVDASLQPTTSVFLNPGSGTWGSTSDRATKENFHAIDARQVLAKVAAMPIESWNYITEGAHVRHLGPVSQDFWTAFGLGPNDTTITNIDEAGVALAAIQGLHQLMQQKSAEITELKRKLKAIEAMLGM
jgi:hypothetical protein